MLWGSAMDSSYSFCHFAADFLRSHGVRRVYTVPGGTILPFLRALAAHDSIQVIVAKDEAGAAHMAEGDARATGNPAVVLTIGGPGVTNALTGVAVSARQQNPLLVISGDVPTTSMGRAAVQDGCHFSIDAVAMSRPATALSVQASSAGEAVFGLQECWRRALTARRPVHLSVPLDVQRAPVEPFSEERHHGVPVEPPVADDRAIGRAAALLGQARTCAILAGRGAAGAEAELLQLAELLDCPVATTCNGKGVFPEHHPRSVGVFSFGSGPLARSVFEARPDVTCAIGTGLGDFATLNYAPHFAPRNALLHFDRDPAVFGRSYPALPVCGDVRSSLLRLVDLLKATMPRTAWAEDEKRSLPGTSSAWLADLVARYARLEPETAAAMNSEATPIRPERVMSELQRALPHDAFVVADIGTSCVFAAHCLKLAPPQRCYIPMGWSCMGHPIAASIGIRLGSGRPTLCITGDGAFLSKGLELHTAVEARLDRLVWLVLSNGGHGMVRLGAHQMLGAGHGVEVGDFRGEADIATIAAATSALGLSVREPGELQSALRTALSADRPCVIDVRVDHEAMPPMGDRIQGLDRKQQAAAS